VPGQDGVGVPAGGTTGQILAKIDTVDYNTTWIDNYTSQVKHEVKAGVALTIGQPVYVTGSTGGSGTNMIVGLASYSSESTSSKTMGLIAQNLAINGFGFVITEGLLAGINTSTATVGDPVWLGPSGTLLFGLANKPYTPNHLVFIGIVTRAQQNNGEIFVKVQNGFELEELHDVSINSPSSGQILQRSGSVWINRGLFDAGIAAVGHTHNLEDVPEAAPLASPTFTGTVTSPVIRLTSTTDLDLVSTGHALQIGSSSALNMAIDNNEIQVRNNGAAAPLGINFSGGQINVGGSIVSSYESNWSNSVASTPAITLQGAAPNIRFADIGDVDAFIGANSGKFYVLGDTNSDGIYDVTALSVDLTTGDVNVSGNIVGTGIPYRMAAGSVSVTQSASVTFPASRFSVAPIVTATLVSSTASTSATVGSVTASGFTVYAWAGTAAGNAGRTANWQAIQMTSGAAAG